MLLLAVAAEPVAPLLRLLTQVTPLEDGGEEVHPLYQTGVWLLHCLQALQLLGALQTAGKDPAKQVSRLPSSGTDPITQLRQITARPLPGFDVIRCPATGQTH